MLADLTELLNTEAQVVPPEELESVFQCIEQEFNIRTPEITLDYIPRI